MHKHTPVFSTIVNTQSKSTSRNHRARDAEVSKAEINSFALPALINSLSLSLSLSLSFSALDMH